MVQSARIDPTLPRPAKLSSRRDKAEIPDFAKTLEASGRKKPASQSVQKAQLRPEHHQSGERLTREQNAPRRDPVHNRNPERERTDADRTAVDRPTRHKEGPDQNEPSSIDDSSQSASAEDAAPKTIEAEKRKPQEHDQKDENAAPVSAIHTDVLPQADADPKPATEQPALPQAPMPAALNANPAEPNSASLQANEGDLAPIDERPKIKKTDRTKPMPTPALTDATHDDKAENADASLHAKASDKKLKPADDVKSSAQPNDADHVSLTDDSKKPRQEKNIPHDFARILEQTTSPALQHSTPTNSGAAPLSPQTQLAPDTTAVKTVPYASLPIEIGLRALDGTKEISIDISPKELGQLNIAISVSHQAPIHISIVAEQAQTLMLLQQDAGHIRHALEQAGFATTDTSLQFSLQNNMFSNSNSQHGEQRKPAARRPSMAMIGAIDAEPVAVSYRQISLSQLDLSI